MQKIFKYTLALTDTQEVKLPADARVLSAISQNDSIVIYALVDDLDARVQKFRFEIVGTGHDAPESRIGNTTFLQTVQHGPFVFHVFYKAGEIV
jgi:hypothetical protein